VIVLVVLGGLYYLSTKGKAKPVPANPPEHLTAKTREQCFVCHTQEKMNALELAHRHPGKWRDERVSCFRCHAPLPGQSALQSESLQPTRQFAARRPSWPDRSRGN